MSKRHKKTLQKLKHLHYQTRKSKMNHFFKNQETNNKRNTQINELRNSKELKNIPNI